MSKIFMVRMLLYFVVLFFFLKFVYSPLDKDVLFLGTSRVNGGIDTALIDEIANVSSIKKAQNSLNPVQAYIILCQTLPLYSIRTVFLEISDRGYHTKAPGEGVVQVTARELPIVREMKRVADNRQEIIAQWKKRMNRFLFSPPSVATVPKKVDKRRVDRNVGIGYRGGAWTDDSVNSEQLDALHKIIALCKKQRIELILFSPPIHPSTLFYRKDMQEAHDFFRRIANREGIAYWDFRLVRSRVLPMGDSEFADWSHLNGKGADSFTACLARVFLAKGSGTFPADMRCADFESRRREFTGIMGLILNAVATPNPNEYKFTSMVLSANPDAVVEYRFEIVSADKKCLWSTEYKNDATALYQFAEKSPVFIHAYARESGSEKDFDARQTIKLFR